MKSLVPYRLPALGALLFGLTLMALGSGLRLWAIGGDPLSHWSFRLPILLSVPVYLIAVGAVLRGSRPSLALILGVAVAARLALLLGPPMLSSDIFRYVWDGRVQGAGINPFLYVPVDPALAFLRDPAIYPHINRATYAHTIYPPAAQILFAGVAALSPTVLAMKAAMVAMEGLAVACLLRLLHRSGRPAAQILIYAWNPLAWWEFAGNGHVDAAAAGLLVLALLLRARLRDGWAGAALGAAVLVKFLPAIVAPAIWRKGFGWQAVLGFAGCIALLYAGYALWDAAGLRVLGFLGAYGNEEGLDTGTGIWALAGLGLAGPLPTWAPVAFLLAAGAALSALGAAIAFRPRPRVGNDTDAVRICSDAAILAACAMVVISPHYAWYYPWLAAPAVMAPYWSVIWLSAGSILLYENPLPDHFIWQALVFAPALALAAFDLRAARRPARALALHGEF